MSWPSSVLGAAGMMWEGAGAGPSGRADANCAPTGPSRDCPVGREAGLAQVGPGPAGPIGEHCLSSGRQKFGVLHIGKLKNLCERFDKIWCAYLVLGCRSQERQHDILVGGGKALTRT